MMSDLAWNLVIIFDHLLNYGWSFKFLKKTVIFCTALYLDVDNYLYSQLNFSYQGLIYIFTMQPEIFEDFFGCFEEALKIFHS